MRISVPAVYEQILVKFREEFEDADHLLQSFNMLTPEQRLELLFMMLGNTNALLQTIAEEVFEGEEDFEDTSVFGPLS